VHCFYGGTRLTPENRLLDPVLGGGAILDVGCYCVSGALLAAGSVDRARVVDATVRTGPTGVDLEATATLELDGRITASLWCAIDRHRAPVLRIHGTDATIVLDEPWLPFGATRVRVTGPDVREEIAVEPNRGLYAYEADVVADAVAAGEQEGVPGWEETLATMRLLDQWRSAT
jgi:predicted dehydrogenase